LFSGTELTIARDRCCDLGEGGHLLGIHQALTFDGGERRRGIVDEADGGDEGKKHERADPETWSTGQKDDDPCQDRHCGKSRRAYAGT